MSTIEIKAYLNFEDLKRDLLKLETDYSNASDELERFQQLFAFAHTSLATGFTMRGKTVAPTVPETLPQKGLKQTQMQKNFALLKEFQDQNEKVGHLIVTLTHNFPGDKNAEKALASAKELEKGIREKLAKATKIAAAFAKNVIPSRFKMWVTRVRNDLELQFKKKFDTCNTRHLVAQIGTDTHFVGYIIFSNLVDDDNFSHSHFYIILTQVFGANGQSNYYASMSSTFDLPGSYPFDVQANNLDQLNKLIQDLLATYNFITKIEPKKLPISDDKIKFSHPAIQSTIVKDNRITITLKKGTKDIGAIRNELKKQLILAIRAEVPRNKDVIRDKILDNKIIFVLTLPHSYKGRLLNKVEYMKLKDILGLSDEQLRDLQNYMDNPS